jgi:CRISPR/Cas system-associated exonuclease Cas4 (RecB family)
MARKDGLIRASELGEYVYCARAWWLRREGVEPSGAGRERLDAGRRWHTEHGAEVTRAQRLKRVASIALFLAAALLTLLILLWWWT